MKIALDDFVFVDFARGDLRALLLHVGANGRIAQLAVQLLEAREEGQAKRPRDHMARGGALLPAVFPTAASAAVAEIGSLGNELTLRSVLAGRTADVDVMPLANVFDVLRDGGVGANSMFVHEGDQFALLQVVRRFRVFRADIEMTDGH